MSLMDTVLSAVRENYFAGRQAVGNYYLLHTHGKCQSSGCANKWLGLPILATALFILFTVVFVLDVDHRGSDISYADDIKFFYNSKISDGARGTEVLPLAVTTWIQTCWNAIEKEPLFLEPVDVRCFLNFTSATSCNHSNPLPGNFFRFGLMAASAFEVTSSLKLLYKKSTEIGWRNASAKEFNGLLMRFENVFLAVTLVEIRRNYWYAHAFPLPEGLSFRDEPSRRMEPARAFLGLQTAVLDVDEARILLPEPTAFYLWQWPRSRFIECNRTSSSRLRSSYPQIYNRPSTIAKNFTTVLAYCRDLLLQHRVTMMLGGGTALGWYRECGIIPYTTDVDTYFLASEWNDEVEGVLKNDPVLKLYWILGQVNDSLELSVYARHVKIDLFALYLESNYSWVGGMIVGERAKLRWTYPEFTEACTGDLFGELFHVPCDIREFLTADYGDKWYEPHHNSRFVWHSSHHNVERRGRWKLSEWKSVYRTF